MIRVISILVMRMSLLNPLSVSIIVGLLFHVATTSNWGSWSTWKRERTDLQTGQNETQTRDTCADPSCQSWSPWVWTPTIPRTPSCHLQGTRYCTSCAKDNDCCTLRKFIKTNSNSVLTIIVFKLNGNSGNSGVPVGPVEERGQDPGPATLVTAPPALAPLSASTPQLLVPGIQRNLNLAKRLTKVKLLKSTTVC